MDTVFRAAADAAPVITIGANFQGATTSLFGAVPPDTNGAVGPDHFVELLNSVYRVYDKSGEVLQQLSLFEFWSSAGLSQTSPFDPRVLYDPEDQRWFATSADKQVPPSNILLAVSNTSDPTEGWQAVAIPGDSERWFDFPTLGFNAEGVFLAAHFIDSNPKPDAPGGPNIAIAVVPKSDLLAESPSAANATVFTTFSNTTGATLQPAVAPQSSGAESLLSMYGSPEPPGFSTVLKLSSLDGPVTDPTLDAGDDRIVSVPPFQNPSSAVQADTSLTISAGDAAFSASVVLQDNRLFGVQTSESEDGGPELHWVMIGDPVTAPVVLDTGTIHPDNLDVYFGSITVNPLGQAVIGFTGSGPDDFASAYAVAGTLTGDHLEFGDPILLQAGTAPYALADGRWGDYSATTYDPSDPTHFWTIQEWASGEFEWSTQITEIIFGAPPAPDGIIVDWNALAERVTAYFEETGQWGLIDDWLSGNPPDRGTADYLLEG